MTWNEAVEEAKEELGVYGWTNQWDEVIELAKEIYWNGEDFKNVKEDIIEEADNKCQLCDSKERLTAHHIFYGSGETICVCWRCHQIIERGKVSRLGFLLQLALEYVVKNKDFSMFNRAVHGSRLQGQVLDAYNELIKEVNS